MVERTRVVGYLRVSTEDQVESGLGLAAQRSKVIAYAELYDLDLVAIVEDAGVSAKSMNRPGLRAVLDALEAGSADGVLVAKLDRLTRSVRDLGTLLANGFRDRFALLSVAEQVERLDNHSFRRAHITTSDQAGVPLGVAMRQTGHSKPDIHMNYRRNAVNDNLAQAVETVKAQRREAAQRLFKSGRIPSANAGNDVAEGPAARPSEQMAYAASSLCSR